jgi:anti-sigma factor RsiW
MKTPTHPVVPEDVMALIDGELTATEATLVSQHIEQCTECAALRDQLRNTSDSLSDWTVPSVPSTLDRMIETRLAETARNNRPPRMNTGFAFRNRYVWAVAGGGAVFGALALLVVVSSISYYGEHATAKPQRMMAYIEPESASPHFQRSDVTAQAQSEMINGKLPVPADAPLIARTASLTVLVKNLDAARGGLDAILTRHHGYSAKLTILEETPPRGLTGTLRIPVAELETAVDQMRALGNVERESQSGEEVTQQHTDLTARLANARETETRLRDILAHRTGKMQDVLDVEEKISKTRGEIEQLEPEQKNLEHRVEFASVDLELVERYEAQLGNPSASISNQVRNSFVSGLRHAGGSLLGLVLFLEEYGPVLLVWLVLLRVPDILPCPRFIKIRKAIGFRH